jgi:hypothetical protein
MVFRFSISDGGICRDARILLVDDTRIRIGSERGFIHCLQALFKKDCIHDGFDVANILES